MRGSDSRRNAEALRASSARGPRRIRKAARKTKGATKSALCQKFARMESPADSGLHRVDGRFASRFLGDLLILTAAAGRDLTDQAEVTALKLTRRELLRRDPGAAAAFDGRSRRRGT